MTRSKSSVMDKSVVVEHAFDSVHLFPTGWVPNTFSEFADAYSNSDEFQKESRGYSSEKILQQHYLQALLSNGTGYHLTASVDQLTMGKVVLVRDLRGVFPILRSLESFSGMAAKPFNFSSLSRIDAYWVEWINEAVARSIFTVMRTHHMIKPLDDMISMVCSEKQNLQILPLDKNLIRHLIAGLGESFYTENRYWSKAPETGAEILELMELRRSRQWEKSEHPQRYAALTAKLRSLQSSNVAILDDSMLVLSAPVSSKWRKKEVNAVKKEPKNHFLHTPKKSPSAYVSREQRVRRKLDPNFIGRCPNPLKRTHVTWDLALDFIAQHHKNEPNMVPYDCPCGAIHIGHSRSSKSPDLVAETSSD